MDGFDTMSGAKINQTFNPIKGNREDFVSKAEFNDVMSKLNSMKKTIEQSLSQSALTSVITQVISAGGGGGSSSGSTVVNVTKSVVGGTTYNEVFSAPALLLTLPISYVLIDGLFSVEHPPVSLLTVSGFTIIPVQDGTIIYSYALI